MNNSDHMVQFVRADHQMVDAVSRYVREGLLEDETCVIAVTPEHRESIESRLIDAGLDPEALSAEYRYIALDAVTMLDKFFDARTGLDVHRFHRDVGQLVRQAAARGQPVRLFGEIVDLLVERGYPAAAIQLEELWNELSRHHTFTLFCTYRVSPFTENQKYRQLLHGTHSHVLPEAS
jgi:hypothetical protein